MKGIILFTSDLDFSVTGNQTLINVIIGTVRNGYKVHILTSSPKPEDSISSNWLPNDVKDKITIYRFNTFIRLFNKLSHFKLLKAINVFNRVKRRNNNSIKLSYESNYTPFSYYPTISFLSFTIGGIIPLIKLCLKNKYCKICGYEPRGILLGYLGSKLFRIDLYKRLQGTILFPELKNTYRLYFRYFFYYLTIKIGSSMTYMGDDGTFGNKVLEWAGVDKSKFKFRRNGYDNKILNTNSLTDFELKQYGIDSTDIILLSISRLEYWKRVDRILYSFASAQKVCSNLKYVIVGGGEDLYRLKSLVSLLDINEKVIFTGRKSHNLVSSFLKRCDIFASCYEHSNMCNPIMEASLLGKPIVSINDNTTKDILIHEYNALLADKNNIIGDLTSFIIRLTQDKDLRKKLSNNTLVNSSKELMTWEDRMKLEKNEI
ncbi:hypothetical protein CL656_05745 [bacterium]|nr:hypothetical protein [bacterium]|tara:strand:- start:1648 stop:2940 length:1293 start_codon:yes stop_codon:yes gene_type:complete